MLEGAAHLAGALDANGYAPCVYDFNSFLSIQKIIDQGKPGFLNWALECLDADVRRRKTRLVGFTLYTNGFRDCIWLATELKRRNPQLVIAAGGPLLGWLEETFFEITDAFDVAVVGEGDEAIVQLADVVYRSGSLGSVPGAMYRSGSTLVRNRRAYGQMKRLPFPLYDTEVYPFFEHKIPVSTLRTSVGCRWARCTYCLQPRMDGRYRERDLDDALAETEHLSRRYGIRRFRLSDPMPDPVRLRHLSDGLGEGEHLAAFTYPEPGLVPGALGGRVMAIFLGLERTAPSQLVELRKCRSPATHGDEAYRVVTEARAAGIATVVGNVVPVAFDTAAAIEQHLARVMAMNPDFVTVTPLAPLPRSQLHRRAQRLGPSSGVTLTANFVRDMGTWELDLLSAPDSWPEPPWCLEVDGASVNPMPVAAERFVEPLAKQGILAVSDEIVLMASLLYPRLAVEQQERRRQVLTFQGVLRDALIRGDKAILGRICLALHGAPSASFNFTRQTRPNTWNVPAQHLSTQNSDDSERSPLTP
jgi:hypothetical protein